MADTAEEFLAGMRADGIPVRMVTLMGNGLSDPFGTPPQQTVDEWVESYDVTDPVLFDRGYACALFPDFIDGFSGESFGFPAWLVVDPELKVIYGNVGFSDWGPVEELIREDLAGG